MNLMNNHFLYEDSILAQLLLQTTMEMFLKKCIALFWFSSN